LVKRIETNSLADEHLAELMPIFEKIRAQDQVPCAFPIHMGAGGTVFVRCNTSRSVPLSPHVLHCHPTTHWVSSQTARDEEAALQEECLSLVPFSRGPEFRMESVLQCMFIFRTGTRAIGSLHTHVAPIALLTLGQHPRLPERQRGQPRRTFGPIHTSQGHLHEHAHGSHARRLSCGLQAQLAATQQTRIEAAIATWLHAVVG